MSSKSNQNSLNTTLGRLTINNDYDVNSEGYEGEQTIITSSSISINGNIVNTAKIVSFAYTGIQLDIPAAQDENTPGILPFVVDGDDFEYTFTDKTVPTWSITTDSTAITVVDVDFNLNNNTAIFTFNNDYDQIQQVISLYVNFFTPPV